jgi:WD40 repeat protein
VSWEKNLSLILALNLSFTSSIRVSSSIYSADARFVLTGSDDGNVRIWKAKASDKLGVITARERAAMEYRESLKERWKVDSEVNRVTRSVFYSFGPLYLLTCSSSVYQHSPSPKISPPNFKTQTYNVGGSTGQRGEEKKTYAGRGSQSETGEEKVGYCGTELKYSFWIIFYDIFLPVR